MTAHPGPPLAGDEVSTLLGFLDHQRAILDWKTQGLDADGLRATVGASTITLGGLLNHLAWVEDIWFSRRLRGNDPAPRWIVDEALVDQHGSWTPDPNETLVQLHAVWQAAVTRSRTAVSAALAEGGLDGLARQPRPNGDAASLRWILHHMIEEYARHNGHADLIRESIDGQTGNPS